MKIFFKKKFILSDRTSRRDGKRRGGVTTQQDKASNLQVQKTNKNPFGQFKCLAGIINLQNIDN